MEEKPLQLKKLTEAFPIKYSQNAYPSEIVDLIPYIFVEDVKTNATLTEITITLVCNEIIRRGTKTFIIDRIREDVFNDKKININLIERYRFDKKSLKEIRQIWAEYKNEIIDETKKNHLVIYLMLFVDNISFEIDGNDDGNTVSEVFVNVKTKQRDTYEENRASLENYLKDIFLKRFNLSKAIINIDLINRN